MATNEIPVGTVVYPKMKCMNAQIELRIRSKDETQTPLSFLVLRVFSEQQDVEVLLALPETLAKHLGLFPSVGKDYTVTICAEE